jgi:hypothetical protein
MHEDDQKHLEALQKILDAWTTIVSEDVGLCEAAITEHATEIFNTFLQCHLAAPEGSKPPVRAPYSSL